jgi:pimeloyl-ACP methyl ester carboxylesterase
MKSDGEAVRELLLPVPSSHSITVQGLSLHYLDWGSPTNLPLLLLHGGSAHAHWWDHIASELAHDYRVIALDFRGHGDSGWATPPAYAIEDYVADVAAVVEQLNLIPFVLIGHSLGGLIALTYAALHATTLRALVVVDMGPRLQQTRRMQLLSRVPTPVYRDEEDLFHRFRLLPEETWAAPSLLQHIARHSVRALEAGRLILKTDRATFSRSSHDISARLPDITCPTLLIRGMESRALSPETTREMKTRCPRLQQVEVPGAGHHVFLDNPAAFVDTVSRFLRQELEHSLCKT